VFVKICGITTLEDARAAVEHGASAVGFVFWPDSPRLVAPEGVREIVEALPRTVATVGVFVNQPAEHINDVVGRTGLSMVQLHGDESPDLAAGIIRPVIKSVQAHEHASLTASWPERVTLLVDATDRVRRGGTGKLADWAAAAALARTRRVLLAGGLRPENVADAIARVQPYGIDVSSGVERSPGVKDHGRIAALLAAVRMAASRT
jgi:phosphoribosylanthranilate isomerase